VRIFLENLKNDGNVCMSGGHGLLCRPINLCNFSIFRKIPASLILTLSSRNFQRMLFSITRIVLTRSRTGNCTDTIYPFVVQIFLQKKEIEEAWGEEGVDARRKKKLQGRRRGRRGRRRRRKIKVRERSLKRRRRRRRKRTSLA